MAAIGFSREAEQFDHGGPMAIVWRKPENREPTARLDVFEI
jgi:hypothetical protein